MAEEDKKPLARQLAQASWVCPLIIVVFNLLLSPLRADPSKAEALSVVFALFATLMAFIGFCCGVAALFGIRRHGAKGIVIPSLIGIVICSIYLSIAVINFLRGAGVI